MATPPSPRADAGERSVAGEAIAAGSPALASSFRFHRPRGAMCARGYCSQCEIETPEGRRLACQVPAGEAGGAAGARDPLRPLGRVAEWFTPWFWERRLLRPRRLRRLSLHALRYLSSAPGLGAHAPSSDVRAYEELEHDVVVVGPDGTEPGAFTVDPAGGDVVLGVYPGRVLGMLRDDRMLAVSFERLVLATGTYERLPPIPGNDLPGVVGLEAAEIYGASGALAPGTRVGVWAPADAHDRARALASRHDLDIVWLGNVAPRRIHGRRRVRAIDVAGRRVGCELFVVGVVQPAIDLALQAGATATLTEGELPILAVDTAPEWLEVRGTAARLQSGVPDVRPADEAIACPCEDVRFGDLRACVAQGFEHAELVKRRTGAMTGPCQGKLCSAAVLAELRSCGVEAVPTRSRPLARPVTLGELAADA